MPDVRLPSDWRPRLFIGGLGGLTLVIVRASQLGFYIEEPTTTALVGWLTLIGLAIISMIGALMTDDYTRTKVYVAGLGAPSLVVALLSGSLQFSSPAETGSTATPSDVPQLGLFFPAVHAQESAAPTELSIEEFDFRGMQSGSITDGLRASIVGQRPPHRNQYLYVVGRTTEDATAKRTAKQLIGDLTRAYKEGTPPNVHLLRAQGDDEIFVSIGSFWSTALEAETLRSHVMSVFLGSDEELDTKNLIREGVVVDAQGLAAAAR